MKIKKKVLIKDLVISAGTVFQIIPSGSKKEFIGDGHIEAVFGLTKDSCGTVTYYLENDDEEKLKEYFVDLKE